jgi:hypothetical protein
MATKNASKLAGPYLRCPANCDHEPAEVKQQVTLAVKSLVHQERVIQNYRRRGDYRPLGRG